MLELGKLIELYSKQDTQEHFRAVREIGALHPMDAPAYPYFSDKIP